MSEGTIWRSAVLLAHKTSAWMAMRARIGGQGQQECSSCTIVTVQFQVQEGILTDVPSSASSVEALITPGHVRFSNKKCESLAVQLSSVA